MLEVLCKNPTIYSFLVNYPKQKWRRCIEAALVCGIITLQSKHGPNPSFSVLSSYFYDERNHKDNLIRQKIQMMKADLDKLNQVFERVDKSFELDQVSTPKFNLTLESDFKAEDSYYEPKPILKLSPKGVSSHPTQDVKKLPRYLQSTESKIKEDVKKDLESSHNQTSYSTRPSLSYNIPSGPKEIVKESSHQQYTSDYDKNITPPTKKTSEILSNTLPVHKTVLYKLLDTPLRERRPVSMMPEVVEPKLCPLSTAENLLKFISPKNKETFRKY
jgi:hypothetical protein